MKKRLVVALPALVVMVAQALWAQDSQTKDTPKQQESQSKDAASPRIEPPQVHEFVIANFKTESGVTLPQARVIYGTYGHLNAAKDNAVLLPSHYMADCHGYEWLGLVLAIVGVYGVMSYSVSQRTHEIGIRMALGAQRRQILRLVGRQGLWVVAAGLGIGMLLAFAVGELIQDFLIGIGPADAVTYTTISILLAAVAMVACLVPARRAVQVDPMVALRNE
jgi:hypothetical protein